MSEQQAIEIVQWMRVTHDEIVLAVTGDGKLLRVDPGSGQYREIMQEIDNAKQDPEAT